MTRREMKQHFATLTIVATVSIITAIGLAIALAVALHKPQDPFSGTTTNRTVLAEPCTHELYENCEAVRVYEDGELVEFYIHDKQ